MQPRPLRTLEVSKTSCRGLSMPCNLAFRTSQGRKRPPQSRICRPARLGPVAKERLEPWARSFAALGGSELEAGLGYLRRFRSLDRAVAAAVGPGYRCSRREPRPGASLVVACGAGKSGLRDAKIPNDAHRRPKRSHPPFGGSASLGDAAWPVSAAHQP